jgi:hypothetical protein
MTAGILAELERHGLRVRLIGDKIAVSPKGAITDEMRQIIRTHRQEIISVLKGTAQGLPEQIQPTFDPASPWPTSLPGYGDKTLGPLTHCLLCRAGTWVRYGFLPVCLSCAWKTPAPPDPETRLSSLLTTWFSMNGTAWFQEAVDRLKNDIMDIFDGHPEAEVWFKEWRKAHPEARLC